MHKKPQELNRPEEGYEKRDLNPGVIVGFAAIVFAMVVGAILITLPIMRGYENKRPPMDSKQTAPSVTLTSSQIERGPVLQAMPEAEREAIETPDLKMLHAYGEVAGASGKLHIPIEEAIGLLADGKAPYKAAAPNTASLTPVAGDNNESTGDAGAH